MKGEQKVENREDILNSGFSYEAEVMLSSNIEARRRETASIRIQKHARYALVSQVHTLSLKFVHFTCGDVSSSFAVSRAASKTRVRLEPLHDLTMNKSPQNICQKLTMYSLL